MKPEQKDRLQCAGCHKPMIEGDGTNWCPSRCTCLGAVWCIVCVNRHLDRNEEIRCDTLKEVCDIVDESLKSGKSVIAAITNHLHKSRAGLNND